MVESYTAEGVQYVVYKYSIQRKVDSIQYRKDKRGSKREHSDIYIYKARIVNVFTNSRAANW